MLSIAPEGTLSESPTPSGTQATSITITDGQDLAESCYTEAPALYRSEPRTLPLDLANAIRSFAILKDDTGQTDEARNLWEEPRNLYIGVNIPQGVAESARRLARLTGQ